VNRLLDDYYAARGWDVETGIPPAAVEEAAEPEHSAA
jgi:hypothetical protein